MDKLPDLLAPDLRLIFVGTAAGRRSAEVGAYYAHPGNRFWRTLHEVGLTPRLFQPHDYPRLLALGIGLTDISKVGAGQDSEIAPHEFDPARFQSVVRRYRPRGLAFTGKLAASFHLGLPTNRVTYGRGSAGRPDMPEVFVLPSPSGLACRSWHIGPWRELADWFDAPASNHPSDESKRATLAGDPS